MTHKERQLRRQLKGPSSVRNTFRLRRSQIALDVIIDENKIFSQLEIGEVCIMAVFFKDPSLDELL